MNKMNMVVNVGTERVLKTLRIPSNDDLYDILKVANVILVETPRVLKGRYEKLAGGKSWYNWETKSVTSTEDMIFVLRNCNATIDSVEDHRKADQLIEKLFA